MNRLIPLCLVLILNTFPAVLFAQKCNFEKNEIDGFSKEQMKISPRLKVSNAPFWLVQMEQKGAKYYFTFTATAQSEIRAVMVKGTKLLVKLDDGTVMEFAADKDIVPAFDVEAGFGKQYVITQWNIRASVTAEQVKQFSNSPISLMRTVIDDKEYNMPSPHDRFTNKVMAMASCMLEKD